MRKIATLFLGLWLLTALTISVSAGPGASGGVGARVIDEGACGRNLEWVLYATGELVITGTGPMNDNETAWKDYRTNIKTVVLGSGVTTVGTGAFSGCSGLTSVRYEGTLTAWNRVAIGGNNGPLTSVPVTFPNMNGWSLEDGKRYFYQNALPLRNQWAQDSFGWLWLCDDGYAVCDTWLREGDVFYYCDSNGYRVTGTRDIGGHSYPFDGSGKLLEVYTVTFQNWDGSVLSSAVYKYGDPVTLPTAPKREADECYTYAFAGWDKAVAAVTGNAVYTATYTAIRIPGTENAIVRQPENVTAESGQSAQFSVEVTGQPVSYRWEYRKIHKWYTTSMEGFDTDTLTVPVTGGRNGYGYRCTVTFADGTQMVSEPGILTAITYITNVTGPNDQTVVLGYKGQFTVSAQGEGLKYRWYYMRPDGTKWLETSMEGCEKPTVYIESTTSRDGYKYRCKITDAAGLSVYSEAATMRVLSFTGHPTETFAATGSQVQFTVSTSVESGFSYQWQYRRNATANWSNTTMVGYNTDTLTVSAAKARNGYEYRCVVTGSKNSQLASKGAVLHVGDPVVITAQPENRTCAVGEVAAFTVAATNAYAYQWQYQTPSGTAWRSTTAEGNTTAAVNVTVKSNNNGYKYRCVITGLDGRQYISNTAVLTLGEFPI